MIQKKSVLILFVILFSLVTTVYAQDATIELVTPAEGSTFNESVVNVKILSHTPANADINGIRVRYKSNPGDDWANTPQNNTKNLDNYTLKFDFSGLDDTINGEIEIKIRIDNNDNPDFYFDVNLNKNKPTKKTVGLQTFAEDTNKTIQLNNLFQDTEGRTSFNFISATSNVEGFSFSGTNSIKIIPKKNFNGNATISVTASDGIHHAKNSFTINITPVDDGPEIIKEFKNKTVNEGNTLEIDLDDHFKDSDGGTLTYNISNLTSNQTLTNVTVEIDGEEFKFTADEFIGNVTLFITAKSGNTTLTGNNFTISVTEGPVVNTPPEIKTFTPGDTNPSINLGNEIVFTITTEDLDGDPVTTKWTVNGATEGVNTTTLPFTFSQEILYTVIATIDDGEDTETQTWTIDLRAPVTAPPPTPQQPENQCGNGFVDPGENCQTCFVDSPCTDGETCEAGVCTAAVKESNLKLILILIIAVVIIAAVIGFGVWYYKRRQYGFEDLEKDKVKSFKPKKFPQGTTARPIPRGPTKKVKAQQKTPEEKIKATKTGDAILRNYMNMAIKKGTTKKQLKEQLLSKKWPKEQIERILKEF